MNFDSNFNNFNKSVHIDKFYKKPIVPHHISIEPLDFEIEYCDSTECFDFLKKQKTNKRLYIFRRSFKFSIKIFESFEIFKICYKA